jgi:two-component system chemotaxis response regulator CheY
MRGICFLMMSGTTDVEQVTAARDAGADGYLLKPFTAATLQLKVHEAFQRRADEQLATALTRRMRR